MSASSLLRTVFLGSVFTYLFCNGTTLEPNEDLLSPLFSLFHHLSLNRFLDLETLDRSKLFEMFLDLFLLTLYSFDENVCASVVESEGLGGPGNRVGVKGPLRRVRFRRLSTVRLPGKDTE